MGSGARGALQLLSLLKRLQIRASVGWRGGQTIQVLSEEEAEASTPPALVEAELEPLLKLETAGVTDAPISEDSARVSGVADPFGTAAQSLLSCLGRTTESPQFGLYL